jgi:hypothetical protein
MAKGKAPGGEKDSLKPQVETSFPTVGIGASAGGVTALQHFFQEIPPDTGAAFVVIVHLEPNYTSELAEILGRRTQMTVQQVNRKVPLEPNKIYVIPPNRRLLITDHEIATFSFDEPRGKRSPIDQFFRSLADQHGDGFAVVLTGAGSDGAVGAKAIKEAGGLILVQDPAEAEYPSMPRSAIATGLADVVLPVRELSRQLVELLKIKAHVPAEKLAPSDEEVLKRILTYLRSCTGHDFLRYKRSTIYRRLARRMQVRKVDTLTKYFEFINGKPDEVQSLFSTIMMIFPVRFESGFPDAPAARRPTQSPCCSPMKRRAGAPARKRRFLRLTSIRRRSPLQERGGIRSRSRPTSARNACGNISPRRRIIIASSAKSGTWSSSRLTAFSKTRHSRSCISYPAAIF